MLEEKKFSNAEKTCLLGSTCLLGYWRANLRTFPVIYTLSKCDNFIFPFDC